MQNWNLTIERKLAADWVLRLGYVGSKATHLMMGYDQNAPIYDFSKTLQQNRDATNQRRPRPEYQNIYTMSTPFGSFYNSLQVGLNKRFSRGFSVLGSYTWSKNLDYDSGNNNTQDNVVLNPFNFNFTRGVSSSDHTQRFVGSYVWELPDPGKPMSNKFMSAVFGNWQMSGIITLQSGRPFNISSSGDRSAGAAGKSEYGDLTGNLTLTGGSRGQQIARYFDTTGCVPVTPACAVQQARPGTYGTLGRNILRGPNFKNADLSISRAFPLKFRDSARLSFRSEFFNAFNRVNLGLPNGTIGNSSFGRVTSTDGGPRILQFSLKAEF